MLLLRIHSFVSSKAILRKGKKNTFGMGEISGKGKNYPGLAERTKTSEKAGSASPGKSFRPAPFKKKKMSGPEGTKKRKSWLSSVRLNGGERGFRSLGRGKPIHC